MIRILLINPNTSTATTDMMVGIAQGAAPDGIEIVGATASRGPPMIVEPLALAVAAEEVVAIGRAAGDTVAGIIVSAFGDPGLIRLRSRSAMPVVGIAEAAMLEAAQGGRRFGIATVTPLLVAGIDAYATSLGLHGLYTGTRLTSGDPQALAASPAQLVEALAQAVTMCVQHDGAEAVVIGGGPLGDAATALAARVAHPVIAPIPAAVRRITATLQVC